MPTDQVQQYDLSNLESRVKSDMRNEMRDQIRTVRQDQERAQRAEKCRLDSERRLLNDEVARLRRQIRRVDSTLFFAIMVVVVVAAIFAPLFFATLDTVKTLAEAAAS